MLTYLDNFNVFCAQHWSHETSFNDLSNPYRVLRNKFGVRLVIYVKRVKRTIIIRKPSDFEKKKKDNGIQLKEIDAYKMLPRYPFTSEI